MPGYGPTRGGEARDWQAGELEGCTMPDLYRQGLPPDLMPEPSAALPLLRRAWLALPDAETATALVNWLQWHGESAEKEIALAVERGLFPSAAQRPTRYNAAIPSPPSRGAEPRGCLPRLRTAYEAARPARDRESAARARRGAEGN